ncbi:MAG: hypothetical protein HDT18_00280 [Oscillibacter sp.]|nr:hypothetical protein [Oscillibacter sp.]
MKKIVSIMLTLVISVVITGCGSSTDSFENQVKSGNYSNAIEIYHKNIVGNSESENTANAFLQDFLDESLTNYMDGTITEQEFLNRYTTIDKINYEIWTVYDLDWVYQQYLNVKESKESYLIAVEYADKGDFEVAISAFSQVILEDIENYSDAQDKLAEVTKIYQEQIIENAKQLAGTDNFEEAAMCINQASVVIGFTAELETCLRDLVTQKYADSIDTAFGSGDYVTVIREYSDARCDSYVTISSDMTNKYSSSVTNYLNDVSKKAEDAFGDNKDYSAAIRILQVAISEVDVDENVISEIEQKIEFYQEYIPVYLTSLEYTQIARYLRVGAVFGEESDVNGTQYDVDTVIYPTGGSLNSEVASTDDEAYVLYNINLKYSTLTGTIYRPYRSLSSKEQWNTATSVKIYGDDSLLYEAPNITKDTYESINFKVDVTGVRNLKIVMRGVWTESTGWVGMYDRNPKVCMAEVTLQK